MGPCLGYLLAKPTWIVIFYDPEFYTEEDQWSKENVEFSTSAAIISASNGSRVALSQHLFGMLITTTVIYARRLI